MGKNINKEKKPGNYGVTMPNSKDSHTGWAQVSTESGFKVKLKVCVCAYALLHRDQSIPPQLNICPPFCDAVTRYLSTHMPFQSI